MRIDQFRLNVLPLMTLTKEHMISCKFEDGHVMEVVRMTIHVVDAKFVHRQVGKSFS